MFYESFGFYFEHLSIRVDKAQVAKLTCFHLSQPLSASGWAQHAHILGTGNIGKRLAGSGIKIVSGGVVGNEAKYVAGSPEPVPGKKHGQRAH